MSRLHTTIETANPLPDTSSAPVVSFREAFLFWLKLGFLTFSEIHI